MDDKTQEIFNKIKAAASVVGEEVGKGAAVVGKKTENLYETAKTNVKVAELNNKITAAYREIGEKVYAAHAGKEDDTAAVEMLISQIDKYKRQQAGLKQQLNEKKQEHIRPVCGQICGRAATYCNRCGSPLEK